MILDSREEVSDIITRLIEREESVLPSPWSLDKVPAEKLEKLLRVIVGFRIEITDIRARLKLSQNRSQSDIEGAIAGLRSLPAASSLADLMAR